MFGEGYFTVSFEAIIGFSITLISVWLIIRQLNEAKLASQMEGMIALSQIEGTKRREAKALEDFIELEDWEKLTSEEAYSIIRENGEYWQGNLAYSEVYELVGSLVRSSAIDIRVARSVFGYFLPATWRKLEKYTKKVRKVFGGLINENWEWLAQEFEKLDS